MATATAKRRHTIASLILLRYVHCLTLLVLFHTTTLHAFSSFPTNPLRTTTTTTTARYADARGSAVLLDNVSVYRGPTRILSNVDWRVEPRTKWALVGANGAGKSTLLQAIADLIPYEGTIAVGCCNSKNNGGIGYLKQTAVAGSNRTIYEEASSGMWRINEARKEMELAQEKADLNAIERATTRFESLGGYQQEQKVHNVLKGLGFSAETYNTMQCNELSGGWQMRVAFARQLLSEPELSLLDEPGNHLDDAAKRWLANYLANYQGEGAMILVTHDVALLQSMDHIAEVIPGAASGSLQLYKSCTYDQYLDLKAQRAAAARTEYERNLEKAAQLQAFVDRFGASATKASAAQSRVKQIEKMRQQGLLDAPAEAVVAQRFRPTLRLPPPPRAVGHVLVQLDHADVGYDAGTPLVRDVSLEICKGMMVLVRGPNGSGKSTLLHALRGTLPLLSGTRKENHDLWLGMFTQDLAQELDPNERAVDIVTAYARQGNMHISDQDARGALGGLGLKGEKALRRLADLSGGEKARVALAMFSLKPSNVYFLDEPSNHLDTECVEALGAALRGWGDGKGAIIVVSHDKTFCSNIEFSHIITVNNESMKIEQRAARESDWSIQSMAFHDCSSTLDSIDTPTAQAPPAIDASLRKKAFNAPKRIAKLESLIEKAEREIAEIDDEMIANGSDVGKLVDLTKAKDALSEKVESFMAEWEELESLLSLV